MAEEGENDKARERMGKGKQGIVYREGRGGKEKSGKKGRVSGV